MRIGGKTVLSPTEFYKKIAEIVYEHARKYSSDELVREFVSEVLGNVHYKNTELIADKLLRAVQNKLGGPNNYLPDAIRNEKIEPPVNLIRRYYEGKRVGGDCDDYVNVLHTLYHSVGIPSVVVFVHHKKLGGDPTVPNHIALAVKIGDKWYIADPTSRLPILPKKEYERIVGPINKVFPIKIDGIKYSPNENWGTDMLSIYKQK